MNVWTGLLVFCSVLLLSLAGFLLTLLVLTGESRDLKRESKYWKRERESNAGHS